MTPGPEANKTSVVLVVDDDETVRLLARASLGNMGLEVVEAANGDEALARVNERAPDLILLDVTLPGRDGFEICAEFRKRETLERVPIVMITGHDDVESVIRSYETGASDFVAKPVNWRILAPRVLSLLRASRTLDELRDSRRQLAQAHRIAQLGSWSYDFDAELLWVSEEARQVIPGLPVRDLSTDDLLTRIHEADRARVLEILEGGASRSGYFSFEFRVPGPSGEGDRHVRAYAESESGAPVLRGTVQDVTEQARAEEQIRFLSDHDSLTFLGNRASFKVRLTQAIERTGRHGRHVGVIFLDLDGFKRINDTLGHTIGDRLLCEVASRLRGCVRGTDSVARGRGSDDESFVARLGGDEFTIVLEDVGDPSDLETVAARIARALPKPLVIEGHELSVTGSMGLATWPRDGDDMETLLRSADVAMYQAKSRRPGSYMFYSQALKVDTQERLEIEAKLRRAIDAGDMQVHFQPLARASDCRIIGCEALARWSPPGEGAIGPDVFIPIAEEMGLISRLGEWVLETACEQVARWRERGIRLPVSVNVSAHQIRPGLAELIEEHLECKGLSPDDLVLEITESVLMREEAEPLSILEAVRELGVGLALDDFGTGYSSLSYLRRFPIDRLKIDRAFVRELETSPEDRSLTAAILAMAKALNLRVIAEGVETEWQRDFLREEGCDVLQGYLIGRPSPANEFEALVLAANSHGDSA